MSDEISGNAGRCPDCLTRCPWCGRRRWETRAYGCGSLTPGDDDAKGCRKSKRLKGVPCKKCGLAPPLPVSSETGAE